MTIRSDITVNWDISPRVITVASGSSELIIQDLHDTCRYLESQQNAIDNPYLIDTAGREFLGGTTYVGLTATLRNAVVAFEARPGPEWELCQILGGNLVAIDDAEPSNYIDPRKPTAYTSVDRTASSAATLQDQAALRYSSYQNAVWLDVEGSDSGTDYPLGTREYPVNNLANAISIANEEGFKAIQTLSSITIGNGVDIRDFEIIGSCKIYTEIIIESSAQTNHLKLQKCNVVSGTLDHGTHIYDCTVGDITNLDGHIYSSGLYGKLVLNGDGNIILADCFTNDQDNPVVIDMGGSGQDLSMPNYAGLITVKNLTSATEEIGIGLNAGMVVLDSTITAGTIIISGVGLCMDNTTGTANVNVDGLVNSIEVITAADIADAVWDENTASHTVSGTVGEALSDTVTNARLIPGVL